MPKEISKVVWFFLRQEYTGIFCEITGRLRSAVPGKGLEVTL